MQKFKYRTFQYSTDKERFVHAILVSFYLWFIVGINIYTLKFYFSCGLNRKQFFKVETPHVLVKF